MASQSLKLGNIKPENAIFFLCDIQEKFRPVIKYFKEILEIAEKLVCLYSLTLALHAVLLKITYTCILLSIEIDAHIQVRHRPPFGGLNLNWWSIPILPKYIRNGSHFLFNSECVIPVYL